MEDNYLIHKEVILKDGTICEIYDEDNKFPVSASRGRFFRAETNYRGILTFYEDEIRGLIIPYNFF